MPSPLLKDLIKGFIKHLDLPKGFAVRLKRPAKNGCTQRSSTATHNEGDNSILADIPNDFPVPLPTIHSNPSLLVHPGYLVRDPGPEPSTNASSAKSFWGESSARKASDMAQTFLPFIQAVAGPIPLAGAPVKAAIGGLLENFQAMDLSCQMQNQDDIRAVLAMLQVLQETQQKDRQRQQEDRQRQQEILMRIEMQINHVQSSVGPNVTLHFVELLDATGHLHPILMDVCDSFEKMLQLLFERDTVQAQIQRRYMEKEQYDLCIDDDKQITRLTSHEWPSIEVGTKIMMSIIIEQQVPSEVYYQCPFCGDVNCLNIGPVMDLLERQAGCSIDCRKCKQRFQISQRHSSAKRDTWSANNDLDFNPMTDTEMRLIRNLHVQQTDVHTLSFDVPLSGTTSLSQSVTSINDSMSSTRLFDMQDVFAHWPPDPRMKLNDKLQSRYGSSVPEHVTWEVYSLGPPNNLTWHTSMYIDDMNYGNASAQTRAGAQDQAAHQAYNHLIRERSFCSNQV
ncbi:hypothetical protein EDB19DRAFT_1940711 [Suillus lakei]|nr:hypothetical protein EDB19DRAFT_1940711 [Suillus lakei]